MVKERKQLDAESIDKALSRIEEKLDYVNRIVDRIEASEKKLEALDQKMENQDTRFTFIETKVWRNNNLYLAGIIIILALELLNLKP